MFSVVPKLGKTNVFIFSYKKKEMKSLKAYFEDEWKKL